MKYEFQATKINNSCYSPCCPCHSSAAELCCMLNVVLCVQWYHYYHSCVCIQTQIGANYDFIVLFYEFRNPTNLGCDFQCIVNAQTHRCCDDRDRTSNCINQQCDIRFRFRLFPFNNSRVNVDPHEYPYHTPVFGVSPIIFSQGPTGLGNVSNPFTITSSDPWMVS